MKTEREEVERDFHPENNPVHIKQCTRRGHECLEAIRAGILILNAVNGESIKRLRHIRSMQPPDIVPKKQKSSETRIIQRGSSERVLFLRIVVLAGLAFFAGRRVLLQ